MSLFHASYQSFAVGQEVVASMDCGTHFDAVAVLEAVRQSALPSRQRCVFATDSVVAATAFLRSQSGEHSAVLHVYEVELPTYHRAPFALVYEISSRLKAGRNVAALIQEYWTPGQSWAFIESFGPSFLVLSEVPAASDADVIRFQRTYDGDRAQAKKL